MASAPTNRHRSGTVTVSGNPATSGNTAVVAAPGAGLMVRVVSMALIVGSANNVKFQSATTDITALFQFAANGGMVLPDNKDGWFQTAANEALNINLSASTAVGYQINYVITQV